MKSVEINFPFPLTGFDDRWYDRTARQCNRYRNRCLAAAAGLATTATLTGLGTFAGLKEISDQGQADSLGFFAEGAFGITAALALLAGAGYNVLEATDARRQRDTCDQVATQIRQEKIKED